MSTATDPTTSTHAPEAALLAVDGLRVAFDAASGDTVEVVRGVSFELAAGEVLGLVGESGCGKTVTGLALLDVLPPGGRRTAGDIRLDGVDLGAGPDGMRRLRGRAVAWVPQDASSALNPVLRLGTQLGETLRVRRGMRRGEARREAVSLLERVAMPDPAARLRAYPHELSGGQRQRAMIALALACGPRLLIADEPTTALDVTVQAQVLTLLDDLRRDLGLAVLLITHDLGVVATVCERALVMYAGEVVESGPVERLFRHPAHPYTRALLASRPRLGDTTVAAGIPGEVPDPATLGAGCSFAPRCPEAVDRCVRTPPWRETDGRHGYRCVHAGGTR